MNTKNTNEISNITRRDISDETIDNKICYHGRLKEMEFLSRLFDLEKMYPLNERYETAYDEIHQHIVNNNDWSEDWMYYDLRINLLYCSDELYLKFLIETVHPFVRTNQKETDTLIEIYNRYLNADGFEIVQNGKMSGRPVFSWRKIRTNEAQNISQMDEVNNYKITMKPLEKVNLISAIVLELQNRMTFNNINLYLNEYGIKRNQNLCGSESDYIQDVLEKTPTQLIVKIGEELGVYKSIDVIADEEASCWNLGFFRIFISHSSVNRKSATNLKTCLNEYAMSGFVAHEDIKPSEEWMREIERSLFSMNVICAILTPEFITSNWCDQEVGVAIGRKILVIPIIKGVNPYGLFGKYQGIQSQNKDANKIANDIFEIVSTNEKTKTIYSEMVRNLVLNAKNKEDGLKWIALLEKIPNIEPSIISELHSKYATNGNLNDESIFAVVNRIFNKYGLPGIDTNIFVTDETETDDLPF